jgi:hypothetical protein
VAKWASQEIDVGQPYSPFRPLVLGPGAVPYVTDPDQAKLRPEAAVLSVLAHGQESEGVEVALAAMGATAGLDDDLAKLYYDLILSALNQSARKALGELMTSGRYEYQSDFARKYIAEGEAKGETRGETRGEAKGEAKAIIQFLEARQITVPEEIRSSIMECRDIPTLDRWLQRAVTARTADQVVRDS